MRTRRLARAAVALMAAYAVALQTTLLLVGGALAGRTGLAGEPICAHAWTAEPASAPAAPAHDCVAACLTGCCCGATALPAPGAAARYAPHLMRRVVSALMAVPALRLAAARGHRSRAPPPSRVAQQQ